MVTEQLFACGYTKLLTKTLLFRSVDRVYNEDAENTFISAFSLSTESLSLHCIFLIGWTVSVSGKNSRGVHTDWNSLLDGAAALRIYPTRVRGFWSPTLQLRTCWLLDGVYLAPDSNCASRSYLMGRSSSQTRPLAGVFQSVGQALTSTDRFNVFQPSSTA